MQEMHITPTAGHLGTRKMCHALFDRVWWPKLRAEVAEFVGKCDVCIRTKDATTRAKGLLQPLPIPPARFTSWSIDFTTGLRLSGGFNAIMTCVDRLTKYTILIPCFIGEGHLSAAHVAHLFLTHVVRRFGVPHTLITDRDPRFVADFWRSLWRLLGSKTYHSTAFHP